MKKFKELVPGDKIYYWDKGRLHEQIVNKCEIVEREQKWTDWSGSERIQKYTELVIQAGKGKTYSLRLAMEYSICNFGGMPRFSCKEATDEWLIQHRNRYQFKLNKLSKQLERYKKILSYYNS